MKLSINDLSAEAFAAFGQVIEPPEVAAAGSGAGWQYWGGLGQMPGPGAYGIGMLALEPVALRFDWAERHAHTWELLVPAVDVVIHVAPPDAPADLAQLPPLERFQLFRVRRGQAVLFRPRVWHGAPLALAEPGHVVVVLAADTGPDNTAVVQFDGGVIEGERW